MARIILIKPVFILLFLGCINKNVISQTVETVVQTGHYAEIEAVCYSPDGKFIATGSNDKTIKLWRASDGREIRSYTGNKSAIQYLEINQQCSYLLSLLFDGTIQIREIATGEIISQFAADDDVFTCASFHPNGATFVAGTKKSHIGVWEVSTGRKIMDIKAIPRNLYTENNFDYPASRSVMYSADGNYIVAGTSDYTAIIWDAQSGKELRKYKNSRSTCTTCLSEARITSDNRYVISGYSDSIKVFDMPTGKLIKQLYGQDGSFSSLAISKDNRYVAAVEGGTSEVWDLTTSKLIWKFGSYSEKKSTTLAFSPDSKHLISGNEKRTADIWELSKGENILSLKGYLNQVDERLLGNSSMYWASLICEAKLSPDGRYIAVGRTGNNVKLVDFVTGRIRTLTGHNSMVISVNFSNDGKYLASGGLDGKAIIWDVEAGKPYKTFDYKSNLAIFSVDISADNSMLAAADWAGYIVIWDIETGKHYKSIYPHGGTASYHIKFAPSGIYIISAGLDRKLKLMEIDTGEEIRTLIGHTNLINSINLSPSGDKIITAAWDGTFRVWDFYSGFQVQKIKAHNGGVYSARYDATGKYIISGGDDNLVKLWDANNGKLLSEFYGHQGGVGDVNLTPDQKYIISGSRDGSVRTWDVEEKKEMLSMIFMNDLDWFIKTPDGYFDASEGAFHSISFVKGTELYSISQFFNEFFRPGLYRQAFGNSNTSFRQNISNSIANYPPPTVEFISPENGASAENPVSTCIVKVTNKGGGIKELKVLHNGKRQSIDDSDLRRMKRDGQYTMKTFDLHLVPGKNEIEISAYSDGDIESEPVLSSVIYKGIQRTSNCYILSIGINKYENENLNLTYARPDAENFADVIGSQGKKLFNKIYNYTLYDREATKEKIMATFDEIARNMKKEDVFIFFYAGHGTTLDNYFYFVTTENTGLYQQDKLKNAIHTKELQDKLKQLPALKQVVFIDACHSGKSLEMLAMRGADEEKALAQLSRSSGIHVMASTESQQQAAEVRSLGHGIFTYVLLEALTGKADGAPLDSKITVYELKSYIDDQVPELSYKLIRHKQFPSTFSMGHDFPLIIK